MDPMLQPSSANVTPLNPTPTPSSTSSAAPIQMPTSAAVTNAATPTPTLPLPPTTASDPNKVVMRRNVRRGSRVNFVPFLIGCSVFFLIILGAVFFVFYRMIGNPTQLATTLKGLNMNLQTAKTLISVFAGMFFGILFFLGMFLLGSNAIRMIGSKSRKGVYIVGIVFGLIIMAIAGVGGAVAFQKIGTISIPTDARPGVGVIVPYVIGYNGSDEIYQPYDSTYGTLVGPAKVSFEFNTDYWTKYAATKFGGSKTNGSDIVSIELDCGNGAASNLKSRTNIFGSKTSMKIAINNTTTTKIGTGYGFFDNDSCIYTKKGTYNPKITLIYLDGNKTQQKSLIYDKQFDTGREIDVAAALDITNTQGQNFSDAKNLTNPIVDAGNQGSQLFVNATKTFQDLGSVAKKQIIYFDPKGKNDFTNPITTSKTSLTYDTPGLSYTQFKIDGIDKTYAFPVSVQGTQAESCNLNPQKTQTNSQTTTYKFTLQPAYKNVRYMISNKTKDTEGIQKTLSASSVSLNFDNNAKYLVRFDYQDAAGNDGSCEEEINLLNSYAFDYKLDADYGDGKGWQSQNGSGDNFVVQGVPKSIKVTIDPNSYYPAKPTSIEYFVNGKSIGKDKDFVQFDMGVDDTLLLDIKMQGDEIANSKRTITIQPNTPDIQINLTAKPQAGPIDSTQDYSQGIYGRSPLAVKLEATTSKVKDSSDKILYFTWDFGDGTPAQPKVSQGFANHTYYFDDFTKNGTFDAKVTVETQKGLKATKTVKINVTQALKEATLTVKSHTTQVANIGDDVVFGIEYNGDIKDINWDFGDGGKSSGDGRELIEATHKYTKAGTYTVNAVLEFADSPPISINKTMKINE